MNTTGIKPTEYNVLVKLEEAAPKTQSGIYLPDSKQDRDQALTLYGTIVDMSPLAFTYERWPERPRQDPNSLWRPAPRLGDKVMIAKGSGLYIEDQPDGKYRLLKDKDICATVVDPTVSLLSSIAPKEEGSALNV